MFEALYYKDKLRIVNPSGDVGIVTLWSPTDVIVQKLDTFGLGLSPASSRIAVLGTLYGNGLNELLHNLLYNPQIRYLLIFGKDLGTSASELVAFFKNGLEPFAYLGAPMYRIVGTDKIMDGAIVPKDFGANPVQVTDFSQCKEAELKDLVREYFSGLPPQLMASELQRVHKLIVAPKILRFPSNANDHNINKGAPLDAWKELIFRLYRFGYRQQLQKGERIELQNMKVVVQNPVEEDAEILLKNGFVLSDFRNYQAAILSALMDNEQSYTYGNRLRGYFRSSKGKPCDNLESCILNLQNDPESRRAYVTFWDGAKDSSPESKGHPCLVSIFFRRFDGKLTLTATFRTHNALDAWMKNFYGLMALQLYVAQGAGLTVGALTVISQSVSVDPLGDGLARALAVANSRPVERELQRDPCGEFVVTVDRGAACIVLQHLYQGHVLTEYRAKKAAELEKMLVRDHAVSLVSHALYLGRELARNELLLKDVPLSP